MEDETAKQERVKDVLHYHSDVIDPPHSGLHMTKPRLTDVAAAPLPTDTACNNPPPPSPAPSLPSPSSLPSSSSASLPAPAFSDSAPPSTSFDDFPDWHGRFEVRRRLGFGAFSTVWLAHDRHRPPSHPHYTVALKRLKPLSTATRIFDEANFLDSLDGRQHVVQLLEVLIDPSDHRSHPTLVLSYTPHSSYKAYLTSLTLSQVQLYLTSLLSAFAHLHAQPRPIIHRDLKPANFLYRHPPTAESTIRWMEEADTRGIFSLCDFGLAHFENDSARRERDRVKERKRRLSEQSTAEHAPPAIRQRKAWSSSPLSSASLSSTATSTLPPLPEPSTLGTRGFRAPEILLRQPRRLLSTALDMWNVGVILLSILCQRYPIFDRSDSEEALVQIAMLLGEVQQVGDTRVEWINVQLRKVAEDYDGTSPSSTPPLPTPSDYPALDEYCWLSCDRHWPADAFDLLRRLLCFDPYERVTAADALQHRFLITDYDERGKAWEERKRSAEANEVRWQQRKERREQRWKRRDKARGKPLVPSGSEKENLLNGVTSRAWSGVLAQQSERTTFTSRAELGLPEVGEEGSSHTTSAAGYSPFLLPGAARRLR